MGGVGPASEPAARGVGEPLAGPDDREDAHSADSHSPPVNGSRDDKENPRSFASCIGRRIAGRDPREGSVG